MKYVDEYRDPQIAHALADKVARTATKPWVLMEVCGGQTHTLMRYGIGDLLPPSIELVHGPGCPVCVTPLELIDQAIRIAGIPGVTFTSYGDMLRVPGSHTDLIRGPRQRSRCARGLFADGRAEDRAGESRREKLFSLGWVLKPRRRRMRWRSGRRDAKA